MRLSGELLNFFAQTPKVAMREHQRPRLNLLQRIGLRLRSDPPGPAPIASGRHLTSPSDTFSPLETLSGERGGV